ncbi:MAG: sulfatase [Candidatus Aegiribacteria sp.]
MFRILFITGCVLMLITSCGSQPRPNVLLIVIDTLRAENLSCYGYQRETSPSIDSLAAEGTLWTSCIAQSSWTLPGFTSILTGTSERTHGAGINRDMTDRTDRSEVRRWENILHPDAPYLPTMLRDAGYRTYAHFNTAYVDSSHGFSRGFDHYTCELTGPADADVIVQHFISWVDSTGSEEPFFALLHLFDPHQPYDPPSPYDTLFGPLAEEHRTFWEISRDSTQRTVHDTENRQHYIDLYDGEIAFADAELANLFSFIRSGGLAENTLIIIVADHGEEFLEHGGIDHGHAFFQEIVHIPLIFSGPSIPAGVRDTSRAGQFDIAPTLLAMLDIEVPDVIEGSDLFSPPTASRVIPSSGILYTEDSWICAVVRDGVKTLRMDADTQFIDFSTDLSADPGERELQEVNNCEDADNYMLTPRAWEPIPVQMDDTLNSVLRDLGYF